MLEYGVIVTDYGLYLKDPQQVIAEEAKDMKKLIEKAKAASDAFYLSGHV